MALPLQKALFRVSVMMRGAESSETGAHGQYPLTLVTAYFELGGRPEDAESENPYPGWIRNFLPFVRWPLVIFCDEQSVDMLKEARGDKPAVWHVTRPEDFYAYRYLDDLKRLQFPAERAAIFIARSLIWHEKHHFLRQALSENPFDSEMLFWCDIGVFRWSLDVPRWSPRRRQFRLLQDIEWPSLEVCRALPQDKVILLGKGRGGGDRIHGCWFGGAVEPSRRWCDAYYRRLEKRKQNGGFIEKEEFVMTSCLRRLRELTWMMLPDSVPYIGLLKGGSHRLDYKWYLLNGRRFPWRYFFRRLFSGPAR